MSGLHCFPPSTEGKQWHITRHENRQMQDSLHNDAGMLNLVADPDGKHRDQSITRLSRRVRLAENVDWP